MVAQEFFYEHASTTPTASSPAGTPPPRKRSGAWLLAAVVAATVAVLGGAGSGALTATLVEHGGQPSASGRTATSATTTTSASTVASTTAETIYRQVSPGVVTITTVVGNRGQGRGTGSGIVLDTRGNILTNYHVIAGAQGIQVTLSDGTSASATVAGTNSGADLAVIKVTVAASQLHPVTLGNSDSVQIGDTVYAIGAPFGLSGSFSEGIVSNLKRSGASSGGRNLSDVIQTDAAINPGNSGGPLVNAQGQVIGINNSIDSPVDGNVGVGFAIPIDQAKQLLSSLEGGSNL